MNPPQPTLTPTPIKRLLSRLSRLGPPCTVLFIIVMLSACAPAAITSSPSAFPRMYEERPNAVLILPPMNESTAADAKEYYATTIQEPLAFAGYYTLPYPITTDLLRQEGLYDTELLTNVPLIKFKEYFGADAVLYSTIQRWDLSYLVLAADLTVSIHCVLKSTTSNRILWQYTGTVVVDLSGGQRHYDGGLAGLVIKAVATAVATAMVDYVPHAQRANTMALSSMPVGKYHPQYDQDQKTQLIHQRPTKRWTNNRMQK